MDEFAYFGIGFAAVVWGVSRLIDSAASLHNQYRYWKDQA